MDTLGIAKPTLIPHATDYVVQMVDMIRELIRLGVAYETSDGVYLEVAQVPGYGLLAQQSLDSLRAGSRWRSTRRSEPPSTLRCGRRPSPASPSGMRPSGTGAPGGTPSVW